MIFRRLLLDFFNWGKARAFLKWLLPQWTCSVFTDFCKTPLRFCWLDLNKHWYHRKLQQTINATPMSRWIDGVHLCSNITAECFVLRCLFIYWKNIQLFFFIKFIFNKSSISYLAICLFVFFAAQISVTTKYSPVSEQTFSHLLNRQYWFL